VTIALVVLIRNCVAIGWKCFRGPTAGGAAVALAAGKNADFGISLACL
jgi:hypothetical protein